MSETTLVSGPTPQLLGYFGSACPQGFGTHAHAIRVSSSSNAKITFGPLPIPAATEVCFFRCNWTTRIERRPSDPIGDWESEGGAAR